MTDPVANASKGTRRRRWGVLLLAVLVIAVAAYVGVYLWTGYSVDGAVARFDARYGLSTEHLTSPPVPATNNRARVIRTASELAAPLSPAAITALASVTRTADVTPLPAELRDFAKANEPALKLLADARLRTESSWEVDYVDSSNAPPFMDLRLLSQAAYVAALCRIEDGQPDEASKYIASGLVVAASLRQEPSFVAQLIRIAIAMQQVDAVQRLITHAQPSKVSLDEIARRLDENRTPDPMGVGLLSEARRTHALLTRVEQGRVEGDPPGPGPSAPSGRVRRFRRLYLQIVQASYLGRMEQLLDMQDGPRPRPPFVEPSSWLPLVGQFTEVFTVGLERAITTGDDFSSALGAADLAVALRRHRLDHGAYPDDLSTLVPGYLSALSLNPFTGKPPAYARQDAGFMLSAPQSRVPAGAAPPTPNWTVTR